MRNRSDYVAGHAGSALQYSLLVGLAAVPHALTAQESAPVVRWRAFADAYYAFDFNRPPDRWRAFVTQPARHNEFAINLMLIGAEYTAPRVRAGIALGTGTYVEANYAGEPALLRNIIEAYGGIRIGGAWLDAGVLPSHIGFESAISAQDWTYSRSLMAEFSPYYETGARLTIEPNDRFSAALLVLNGWQNIRESNDAKAVGLQLQYRTVDRLLLNYSNFLGDEALQDSDGAPRRLRFFNNFYAQFTVSERLGLTGSFDVGTQEQPAEAASVWYAGAVIARVRLATPWTLGARAEHFHDPDQVVVGTGTTDGFIASGASVNLDYAPVPPVLLRLEARILGARHAVWPAGEGLKKRNSFIVSSLAVTL